MGYASNSQTEAAVIADLAQDAALAESIDRSTDLIHHAGRIIDLEQYQDHPRRIRGTVDLHDVASLIAYCKDHEHAGTRRVYVDRRAATFVAVLDSHTPLADFASVEPSWCDHQARVELVPSPEWMHWKSKDRHLVGQVEFAHHVEQHLVDVVEPDGATLLEIVSTIEGTKSAEFLRSERLDNGQRRFVYRETIEGRAGQTGQLEIPAEFTLGIPVFDGDTEGFRVTARLRWRITGEGLKLGYELDRPDVVWRAAVDALTEQVESQLGVLAYLGVPAS